MGPLKNMFTQFMEHKKQEQQVMHQPQVIQQKPIEKPKKKIIKKIIKKKPVKKTVVSVSLDSDSESEVEEIEKEDTPKPKKTEFDLETELQITSYKIKIKLFITEKIEKRPSIQNDVFTLLNLLLLKHNVKLKKEEQQIFPKIFHRIFEQDKYKQKIILQDIVKYLVDAKFDILMT